MFRLRDVLLITVEVMQKKIVRTTVRCFHLPILTVVVVIHEATHETATGRTVVTWMAACRPHSVILNESSPWRIAQVPPGMRCQRPACKAILEADK